MKRAKFINVNLTPMPEKLREDSAFVDKELHDSMKKNALHS